MSTRVSVPRAALAVSAATALSRLLGVAREMTLSHRFPVTATDAFVAAFRVPNLLRDLLAEGALAAAFIPVFARVLEQQGREAAFRVANAILARLLVVSGGVALVLIASSRLYATFIAAGFSADALDLTAWIARLLAPFLVTVSLASVLMGMANVRGRFFTPALAPALFNIGILAGGWLLAPRLEEMGWPGVTGLAIGAVAGGLLQLAVQIPGVSGWGFRFRPRWEAKNPDVREIVVRLAPSAFGIAATYVNVIIDTQVASFFGPGPVSHLFYAMRLWMLPIGVVGVGLATANLAQVSADAARRDWASLRRSVSRSLEWALLAVVPAAVGLFALRGPIVRVVYQHGLFDGTAAASTAAILGCYAVGLPGYALVKVLVPTVYALGDTRTPARLALATIVIKVLFSVALVRAWGVPGLALATGLAATFQAIGMGAILVSRAGGIDRAGIVRAATAACFASVAMGLVVVQGLPWIASVGESVDWTEAVLSLAARIALGVATVGALYFVFLRSSPSRTHEPRGPGE